jgi:hypothetical protein
VILWECLTGRSLWAGATLSDLFTSQLARPAPPIAKEVEGLPPELAAMIDMLLDRNPTRRPESARHVREALRRLTHGTIAVGQNAPVIIRPSSSPKTPLILGVVALAGVVLVAITMSLSGGDPSPSTKTPDATTVDAPAPKDSPTPDAKPTAVPTALTGSLEVLLTSADKKARKAAADAIAAYEPATDVPPFARNIASLERQTTCPGKLTLVERISADGDARALPALHLLEKTPRKGCDGDCIGCLREPLARAIGRLEK